jgi:hypothetical protein
LAKATSQRLTVKLPEPAKADLACSSRTLLAFLLNSCGPSR